MLHCKFCNKEYKNNNGLKNHEHKCPLNKDRKYKNGMLGKKEDLYPRKNHIPWNKGISKEDFKSHFTEESWKAINWTGRKHSENTKELMSIKASERHSKNSKYSRNIEYKPGIILESSYEVKVAEILDSLNIEWTKVRKGYIWNDNGKIRRYVPDFYIPSKDMFLDPKNDYLIEKDKIKIRSAMELNFIKVVVLSLENINEQFIKNLVL